MTNIRRYDPIRRPVFITAASYHRQPFLETDWQKDLLLSVMRDVKASSGFSVIAYVIMDDLPGILDKNGEFGIMQ